MTSKPAVICVFCASNPGRDPAHLASARDLARAMHASNVSLVYGGGTLGLMGELAKTLVSLSGPQAVHGVIPRAMVKRVAGKEGKEAWADATFKKAEKELTDEEIKNLEGTELGGMLKESDYGTTTIVEDMHTRKRLMAQKVMEGGPGSGFVALAGGYGTIEEVMEMVTWNQLGIHARGIVLLNIKGYWDGLLQWVRNAVQEGYVGEGSRGIMIEVNDVKDVLSALQNYQVAQGRFKLDWGQS